ncbi:MAG: hypothetical protein CL908_13710 [Deltaproteobacteria bacterium]|jgi:hypothetical protein|nr:hypothetical protein [Deltaproteobacteria bacterium]
MSLPRNIGAGVWLLLFVGYLAFFSWYTSFGGPLTSEEIAHYSGVVEEISDGDPQRIAAWQHFVQTDTGDDWGMISVVDLNETPRPIEGVEPGESSEEVLAKYTDPFFGRAVPSAGHPVLVGRAAAPAIDIWGVEGATDWSQGVVVRWRSRRDFLKVVEAIRDDADDSGIHAFKIAAIEKTIAYPLDPWFHLGDPRIVLSLLFAVIGLSVQASSPRDG